MKRVLVIVAVTALLIAGGVVVWTQSSDERRPGSLLQQASESPVVIQYDQGVPRFMKGSVQVEGATPTERSYAYLDRFSELYALEAPRQELEVVEVESSEGVGSHVRFEQHEGEVPVYGGELVVHLKGSDVVSTTGTYLAEVPKLEPKVDAESALGTAREAVEMDKSGEAKPELTYFDADLLMTPDEIEAAKLDAQTHLAWTVDLNGLDGEGRLVSRRAFVDAQTGELILEYDLRQSHAAQKNIWIRTANGGGPGWFCSVPGATDWFDTNGVRPGVTPDAEGNASFAFVNQVYDYFYNTFHRHSFDGGDRQLALNLDFVDAPPLDVNNAAWIPTCNHMVFNNNMVLLDVMAHEITHGVIDYAVPGGLEYLFQSGALNESYADVFAVLIDAANWTIGERPGFNPVRDFSNPPARGQPDTMPVRMFAASVDNGGVHVNSGIPNKVGFLLMQGGFHNGRNVVAINRGKSALLWYEVLDNWLSKTSNFLDFRNAMVSAASVWATIPRNSFTNADVCRVVNAFGAVAIASGDADCDGTLDSAETDADNDTLADAADNCPFIPNVGQAAADNDGTGDVCDTDDDNDTILDDADNCRTKANLPQGDADTDGVGDVCDLTPNGDKDLDGVDDLKDNCKGLSNPDQLDTDTDTQGNRCDTDDDGDGVVDQSDNCSLKANPTQTDTDKDGSGDACDDTPLGPDNDKDGDPDSSDPDDDNDSVKDDTDNCPLVANASQIDLDHDGTGHACDPDEALTSQGPLLRDAIDARARHFERFQIMVLPCLERCEPGVPMEIRLEVDIPLVTRLLDEAGNVIAEGSNKEPLVFEPNEGLEYRLEILPRDLSLSREHPLELELIPKP